MTEPKSEAIKKIEKEIADRKAAEKAARDAEWARIAAEFDKQRKAEEDERRRQIEAEDKRREEQFERALNEDARALFFNGNYGASEELWKSVREEYRRKVLMLRAEDAARDTSHVIYKW